MQVSSDTITIIANRAAAVLAEWIGLSPLAKSNNGDRSSAGGIGMILGAMVAAKAPPPPTDATSRMAARIKASIASQLERRGGQVWMTYDVDYGPGRELSDLSEACDIKSSWPIKSCLNITIYENRVSICDRRGYGAEGLTHHLVDGRWVVSPCTIDSRLMPMVLAAVERGEVDANIVRIDA